MAPSPSDAVATPSRPQKRWRSRLLRWGRLLIGLGLLAYVLYDTDWSQLAGFTGQIQIGWLLLFLIITPLSFAACVHRWQVLLRVRGYKLPFFRLLGLYFLGQFYNHILPSSTGGDIVRIVALRPYIGSGSEATASIVAERFTGLTVLMALGVTLFFYSPALRSQPVLFAIVLTAAVGYVLMLTMICEPRLTRLIGRRLAWLPGMARIVEKVTRFQRVLREYATTPRVMFECLFLSAIFYGGTILSAYVACRAISQPVPFLTVLIALPVVQIVGMLPITINGYGLREWAFTATFGALGALPAAGLAASLLMRFRRVAWSSVGYLGYLLLGGSSESAARIRAEAQRVKSHPKAVENTEPDMLEAVDEE